MNENESRAPHPGLEIARSLKIGGCVLVLLLTGVCMLLLLTSGRDPIKGYSPPETSEYYSSHLDELQTELETNVFPHLTGVDDCREEGDHLVVTLSGDGYAVTRSAILRYFDPALFEFKTP